MIGIRADGNGRIGLGHVMRCLSVADKIKALGEQVIFFVAEESPLSLIQERGYEALCLSSNWNCLEEETGLLLQKLMEYEVSLLLVDSYFVTEMYLQALKKQVKVAYLDDVNAFPYPVDMLINYSVYAFDVPYVKKEGCEYLLGTAYAPLREQFERDKLPPKAEQDCILVLSGGTDPFGVAEEVPARILEQKELSDYRVAVVLGSEVTPAARFADNPRVTFYKAVTDMAGLMRKATFGVSAGGSSLYELCACQVPTVTYSFADNQFGNVEKFHSLQIMPYAGDLREQGEQVFDRLVRQLADFHRENQKDRLTAMSQLVDGKGALRIAERLISLAHNTYV